VDQEQELEPVEPEAEPEQELEQELEPELDLEVDLEVDPEVEREPELVALQADLSQSMMVILNVLLLDAMYLVG
jgi:hypothetical protein